MIHWNVDPEIIKIGFFSLRYYSLLFMISFLTGIYIMRWMFKLENRNQDDVDQLLIYMLFGTVIGARLGHCLFYDPIYYLSDPILILKVWQGGLASHGAAIGILISLYMYKKKHKDQPYLWIMDRVVVSVALAAFFIRVGNLFNSEIIGKPTHADWGVIFDRIDAIPRHPSQLYEAFAYLVVFLILINIYKKYKANLPEGLIFGIFLIGIFGFRIIVEFYKENQSAFEAGMMLDMGQILSIPLVLAGIYFVYRAKKGHISNGAKQN
jgi:prolipoprotein diacylglyceryl transferase